ncbi:leucine-rich repeat extensin-like protein 3 [Drosophila subobscura]|uniref:leucine-rich repeat extensin-like protein 3 n=1 Tax=Drosophila subobscura TaxID=7241 RepID=UPI00155A75A0|nr:leucine-rich repeat extensin-like protein 3 [Drosophila subobscura]
MLRQLCPVLLLVALTVAPASSHATIGDSELRDKRGAVTIDLGQILRNVLLKSAQFSNAKAALAHPTRRPTKATTTTTTTTTSAPPVQPRTPPPAPPRQRPIWQPHGYYSLGYLPFDYDNDYPDAVGRAPAGRPPQPAFVQRKPAGPAPPARYEPDYDYGAAPPPPPPPPKQKSPPPRPRLRAQPQPQPRQPTLPQAGLGDRLVYQYAQPSGKIQQLLANCRTIGFSPTLCRYLL